MPVARRPRPPTTAQLATRPLPVLERQDAGGPVPPRVAFTPQRPRQPMPRIARRALATAREMERFRARVYRLVALIPEGRVATYGQLAALAGHPRRARHVGNALKHSPEAGLPWHRVLNAQGKVSARAGETRPRGDEPVERRQVRLLEAEGVRFAGGKVDLARHRWRPEEEGGAFARGLGRRGPTH